MKRFLTGSIALAIATGLLGGYHWYERQNIQLTTRPDLVETQQDMAGEPSMIGLRVSLSHEAITAALTNLSDKAYRDSGRDEWDHQTWIKGDWPWPAKGSWKTKGPKLRVGYRWDVEIRRSGPVSVGAHNERLRVTVPIHFKGNAGLRGDGAKILRLHKKNFDGTLTAYVDLTLDLDEDWCPVVSVDVSHHWNSKAKIEIIDGVFVSVSGLADDLIADQVKEVRARVTEALDCQVVREAVAPYWRSWSVPVAVNEQLEFEGELSAHANVVPQDIAFSGLHIGQKEIGIAVTLTADAAMATQPVQEAFFDLPPLKRAAWEPGNISLDVPVAIAMEDIASVATDTLTGKSFAAETPLGEASVEMSDIEVYQSADRVVVGAEFVAEVDEDIFSTSGKVYLSAIPRIDPETDEVYLEGVSFSRVLDNELWNFVSAVFKGPIASAIANGVRYDLTDDLASVEAAAQSTLNEPGLFEGVAFNVTEIDVAVAEPMVSKGEVIVAIRARATVDAQVQPALLAQTQ